MSHLKSSVGRPKQNPPAPEGLAAVFPSSWVPFAEVSRLNNPAGSMNIFFACFFGLILASGLSTPMMEWMRLVRISLVLLVSAFLFHSWACVWNDIVDADLDKQVERTKYRPLPRGAVFFHDAYLLCAAEALVWAASMWLLSPQTFLWALPFGGLFMLYPFCKRFTDYPQIIMGIAFSGGEFIGYSAAGRDPLDLLLNADSDEFIAFACFFISYCIWCMELDIVYAHQDLKEDLRVGIKSMAVRYRYHMKYLLSLLAIAQVSLMLAVARYMKAGIFFLLVTCGGAISVNLWMLNIDLSNSKQCWDWFKGATWAMGAFLCVGTVGTYGHQLNMS